MKRNLILLPQLLCVILKVSGSLHLSAHKTLVSSILVSQGTVATRLRCGGTFNESLYSKFSAVCANKRILKIC